MKKIICLVGCVLMVFVLFVGCGAPADTSMEDAGDTSDVESSAENSSGDDSAVAPVSGDIVIGVSMVSTSIPFYSAMVSTFESYGEELGIKVVVADANSDLQTQVQDIDDLVAQGIDALIINPFEADAFVDKISELKAQGIYVVTVDNDVSSDTPVDAAVLTDNFGNGVAVGKALVEAMGNTPIKAFLVSGDEGSYVGQLRRDGLFQGIIEEQLARYGKTQFEIVYQTYVDGWSYDVAVQKIADIAQTLDFNVLLSEADVVSYQGIDTFKEMGVWDTLYKASSADCSKEILEYFIDGSYKNGFSALNSPSNLAKGSIDVCIRLLNGETVARDQLAPVELVTDAESAQKVYDPNSIF